MVEVKEAGINDAEWIAVLGRVTFRETFGHLFRDPNDLLNYLERTFSKDKISKSLGKEDNVFFIIQYNGLPAGYAKVKLNSPSPFILNEKIAQLQKIYILKDYLGLGLGKELQANVLELTKRLAYKEIWLSVLKENEKAIRFYLKTGYRKIGEHPFSIGQEDFNFLVLARPLD